MIVNRTELANVLGCAKTTVDTYVEEGMPYIERADRSRGEQWRFETREVIEWLVDRNGSSDNKALDAIKLRERTAIAISKELDLAERQKVLVHIDDIAERLEVEYAIIKSKIRAIPGRLAQRLAITEDAAEVERLIKNEVADALDSISEASAADFVNEAKDSGANE